MDPVVCPPKRRYKREAVQSEHPNVRTVTIGPIRIVPNDPCLNNNGDCSEGCHVVTGKVQCHCYPGMVQSTSDHRICHKLNPFQMKQLELAHRELTEGRQQNEESKDVKQEEKVIEIEQEENVIEVINNEPVNNVNKEVTTTMDDDMIAISKDEFVEFLSNAHTKDILLMGVAALVLIASLIGAVLYCRKGRK